MNIHEDAWLTAVFGYPVFAVEEGSAAEIDRHAAGSPRAFYFAKVPVDRVERVDELTGAGFSVVDVNVTFAREPTPAPPAPPVSVAPLRPQDGDAVAEIAGSCFRYSRFHLDPHLPRSLADDVKREWIHSYVEGRRGVEVLVASDGERPTGFLAVLEDGDARVIDLVGVDTSRQGRGIGGALVATFIERHGPHARELRVGTQLANASSLRLYERLGFVVSHSAYVLHRHVGGTP